MSVGGSIRVDRARLHGGVFDDRARLAGALDGISPAAIGLSPQAVLVVRRLAPRAKLPRRGAPEPFVFGVQEELRRRVVAARRGRTGGADEDLLFEDAAELEAAIVADWLAGSGPSTGRWWSQVIADSSPILRWRRTILDDPDRLARAVLRLVQTGDAVAWLAAFEPAELIAATKGMLKTHGAAPAAIVAMDAGISEAQPRELRASIADLGAIAPEAVGVARRDIAVLIAAAVVLVRRPAWLGTQGFARAIAGVARAEARAGQLHSGVSPGVAQEDARARREAPDAAAKSGALAAPERTRKRAARPGSPVPSQDIDALDVRGPPRLRPETEAAAVRAAPAVVATEFGGLFFLLNVFLVLGLYGDFTRPADGIKGLSPFELLLLLARRWFGDAFEADPLAAMLRDLAGLQPGEAPGRQFEAPIWSVPESWLSPWPDARRNGRGDGFTLADDPHQPRSPGWRRRRWVACLARYLRARLARALGENDRAGVVTTCRQLGRIARDRDRIEVHFPLADHPIALRMAGVDRDPGWIPAAGHFIEFRFL